jgi:cobalt-zinc-cadmium efflux system outer membrane protein
VVEVENVFGTGELQGIEAVELTLALSQLIELGNKRELRVGLVGAEHNLYQAELERERLEIVSEVLKRFLHAAAEQHRLQLAEQSLALARKTLAVVDERVEAALAPAAERHRASAALERISTATELTRRAQARAMDWLAAMWGDELSRFSMVSAELMELPALIDLGTVLGLLEQRKRAAARRLRQRLAHRVGSDGRS